MSENTQNSQYPQDVSQDGMAGVIGRVLGGRYRLVTRIGAGRFTTVYLAHDLSRSRRVAVKLLSDEVLPDGWRSDREFTTRLLESAERAATVSHPRIAAVYDQGDSDHGLFVVSQYFDSGSLKGMLDSGYLLSPSQALMVGLEVARGLEHIHHLGFIHGDIRPSNILFDSRGRSCLADLGTSLVLSSSESAGTLVARSVFSTLDVLRYASPEQAQGLAPDHKSDVYSLVLVLTEALSGRVPFEADDPEYTQMAKMSRQLDLAGQFGRLGRVLEQAGRPERDDRPSAHDLAVELLAAAQTLPRPAPLPLTRAELEIPESDKSVDAPVPGHAARRGADAPSDTAPRASRSLLRALLVLLVLGAVGFGAYKLWEGQFRVETQPVPDLAGATEADLLRIESDFGWVLNRLDQRQDGTVAGDVLRQSPQPGAGLERGETVSVWVSLGPELVSIPGNLVGLAVEDAEISLSSEGLSVGEISERHDEEVPDGAIVEVDEIFPEVDPGSSVDLVVSLGPVARVVPEINPGAPLAVAREMLDELRLELLEWPVPDNLVEAGHVVRVEPLPGTEVAVGSLVTVVVSNGPEKVRVPQLATLGVEEAAAILKETGLCQGEIEGPLDTEILASNPPAEAVVDYATCVSLITRPEETPPEES